MLGFKNSNSKQFTPDLPVVRISVLFGCALWALSNGSCQKVRRPDASTVRPVPPPIHQPRPLEGTIDRTGPVDECGRFELSLSLSDGNPLPPVIVGKEVQLVHGVCDPFDSAVYARIRTAESDMWLRKVLTGKKVLVSFKDIGQRRIVDQVLIIHAPPHLESVSLVRGIIQEVGLDANSRLWVGLVSSNGFMFPPVEVDGLLLGRNHNPYELPPVKCSQEKVLSLKRALMHEAVEIYLSGKGNERAVLSVVLLNK